LAAQIKCNRENGARLGEASQIDSGYGVSRVEGHHGATEVAFRDAAIKVLEAVWEACFQAGDGIMQKIGDLVFVAHANERRDLGERELLVGA